MARASLCHLRTGSRLQLQHSAFAAVAVLVLLPASARARIVAADLARFTPHGLRNRALEPVRAIVEDHVDEGGTRLLEHAALVGGIDPGLARVECGLLRAAGEDG